MLRFNPANKVASKMPAKERNTSPAVLDIKQDAKSEDVTRVLIDVRFKPVKIPRPLGLGCKRPVLTV
jgi:hypothetical protein